jgi:ATP-binding cassette subfamily B multidrug efflux pump
VSNRDNETRSSREGRIGKFDGSSLKLMYGRILRHKKAVGIGIIALVGVDGLQLLVPQIFQRVIDNLASGGATSAMLWKMGLLVVGISIGMGICRFFWRYLVIGSSHRIARDLRQEFYDHLQKLPPQYYDKTKVGDVMAHATNDINAVRMATGMATIASCDAVFLSIASIVIMLFMNWKLTLLALIPLPVIALMMLKFGALIHSRFEAVQEAFSMLTEKAQESLSGIRVVKAYGDEASEEGYFAERAQICVAENVRLARVWGMFQPVIGALAMTGMAILLGAGGSMVIKGTVSLGEFVAFTSYLMMLIWPMIAIGWVVNLLQRGAASMGRLMKIMRTVPDITDGPSLETPTPAVEVRNLTFAYEGTDINVLQDLCFSLCEGSTLGIVGRTGSGKTTLVELMMRLYDPPQGSILVGGIDVRDLKLEKIRGLYGYVPQETFLFAMSIAGNISFGLDTLEMDRIRELAGIVDIEREISEFPGGFETMVGERGVTLSGGQKQRIAIARALAVMPDILVLDDALSSVDTETEAAILDRLRSEMKDLTCIVIAHRISTVKRANLIIVLDGGAVVEQGTHEELIALGGYYAELHAMQQLEEEAMKEGGED